MRRVPRRYLRRTTQLASLALFFWLYYKAVYPLIRPIPENIYLQADPLVVLSTLFSLRYLSFAVVFGIFSIGLTLFLGRFYCGWLCPLGTTLDIMGAVIPRLKPKKEPPDIPRSFKYLLLAVLLISPFFLVQFTWVPDPLVAYTRGFSFIMIYGDYYILWVFLVVALLYHPRIWCRRICPLGTVTGLTARYRVINRTIDVKQCNGCMACHKVCVMKATHERLEEYDPDNCISCCRCQDKCPQGAISFRAGDLPKQRDLRKGVTRREFVLGLGVGIVTLSLAGMQKIFTYPGRILRPPGSLREDQFLAACVRCEQCLRACPSGVLKMTFFEAGLPAVLTPRLDTSSAACELCGLCIEVCPTEALQKTEPDNMKMGTARLDRKKCLPWAKGKKCVVCYEQCPVGAVSFDDDRPLLDDAKCAGCGACQVTCPARPLAIKVSTAGERRPVL